MLVSVGVMLGDGLAVALGTGKTVLQPVKSRTSMLIHCQVRGILFETILTAGQLAFNFTTVTPSPPSLSPPGSKERT